MTDASLEPHRDPTREADREDDREDHRGDDPELPETVVTFGGNGGQRYHRQDPLADDPAPACGAHGRNPLAKPRRAIESHYDPCGTCFHDLDRDDE